MATYTTADLQNYYSYLTTGNGGKPLTRSQMDWEIFGNSTTGAYRGDRSSVEKFFLCQKLSLQLGFNLQNIPLVWRTGQGQPTGENLDSDGQGASGEYFGFAANAKWAGH